MRTADVQLTRARRERQAFLAAVAIGCMASLMVALQFVGKPAFSSPWFWVQTIAEVSVAAALAVALPASLRTLRAQHRVAARALEAKIQLETLFQMTDLLQSALDHADANAVLQATASKLLPDVGGALYVFNNSGDRLELSTVWGWPDDQPPPDAIPPLRCWAMKRGKPHVNDAAAGGLLCEHHATDLGILEFPMIARGEILGLLCFHASAVDPLAGRVEPSMVQALADGMSLALSNIALRDKLRSQALRDPLTGLYNRRYMEDALARYANLSGRGSHAFSLIMIDLDHFKRLNDEHGHALGDAVLSEVAATIAGAIRPCDIACRYGGEELVVLLPDCTLADAAAKAEVLRARTEKLSDSRSIAISASFGVAAIPDSSACATTVLKDADAALYRAKAEGRNRVACAETRALRSFGLAARSAA